MELITASICLLALFMMGVSIRLDWHVRSTANNFKKQDEWIQDELDHTNQHLLKAEKSLIVTGKMMIETLDILKKIDTTQ